MKRLIRNLTVTLGIALAVAAVAFMLHMDVAMAQNATPTFPPQGATLFGGLGGGGVANGCAGTTTLANGVKTLSARCIGGYPSQLCQTWANGASAQNYAAIGIGCVVTTTATATSTATATATTAAYGGTTIATATATSTATSTAIPGLSITASTLNASPVVTWDMIQ